MNPISIICLALLAITASATPVDKVQFDKVLAEFKEKYPKIQFDKVLEELLQKVPRQERAVSPFDEASKAQFDKVLEELLQKVPRIEKRSPFDEASKAQFDNVLEELKEYFQFKENGGTLQEFIQLKKEQAQRQKRDVTNEAQPQPQPEAQPQPQPEPQPETKPETKPENKPQGKPFDGPALVKKIKECIAKKDDRFRCVVRALGTDIVTAKAKIEHLLAQADEAIKAYFDKKGEKIRKYYVKGKATFGDKVYEKTHDLKEKAEKLGDKIDHKAESFAEKIKNKFTSAKDKVKEEFNDLEFVKDVKKCIENNPEDVAIKCVAQVIGTDLEEAKDKIAAAIKAGGKKVADFFKKHASKVREFMEKHGIIKTKAEKEAEKAAKEAEKEKQKQAAAWFEGKFPDEDDDDDDDEDGC